MRRISSLSSSSGKQTPLVKRIWCSLDDLVKISAADLLFVASSQHILIKKPPPHSYSSMGWNKDESCALKLQPVLEQDEEDQRKEQTVGNPWSLTNKDMTIGNLSTDAISTSPCGNLTSQWHRHSACENRELGRQALPTSGSTAGRVSTTPCKQVWMVWAHITHQISLGFFEDMETELPAWPWEMLPNRSISFQG